MSWDRKMIVIINSAGVRGSQSHIIARQSKYLPYASSVIVAVLRKNGFNVMHKDLRNSVTPVLSNQLSLDDFEKWLDFDIRTSLMEEYLARSLQVLPDLAMVKMVGISIFTHNSYSYALALAKEIKRFNSHIPICFGGSFITIKDLDIPEYVDFFVKGNGGKPIVHLAHHFLKGASLDKGTPGLSYVEDGKTINNGKNREPAQREELPDFSGLDLDRYLRRIPRKVLRPGIDSNEKFLVVPYRTSLGCHGNCSFCTGRLVDRLGFKSVDKVVEEIKAINGLHENVLIRFCDSSINNNPKVISRVFDKLIEDGFRFNWNAYVKVDNMSLDLLEKFAITGCNLLAWGLESASSHMINVFGKGFDLLDAEKYIQRAAALGIKNVIFLMFNGPGENMNDVFLTQKFVRRFIKNENVSFQFFSFGLEEGCEIHTHPEKFGIEIMGRSQKDNYVEREQIDWREVGLSRKDFEKKRKLHTRREELLGFFQSAVKHLQRKGVDFPEPLIFFFSKVCFHLLGLIRRYHLPSSVRKC